MTINLVKNSKILGQCTPKWTILCNGKFICGGNTQKETLDKFVNKNTFGTVQNYVRLGQYEKVAKMIQSS